LYCELKTSKAELRKLQRLACLDITGAIRTSPTAALEILLGLPPLHLQLEAEAMAGIYRLQSVINGNLDPMVSAMHT
jgi:hypothetical protein